jgi:hypothetical protein
VTLPPQVACAKPQLFATILQVQAESQYTLLQCDVLGASDQALTDEMVEMEQAKTSQSCVRLFHLCPRHPCSTPDLEFAFHPAEISSVGDLVPRWAFSIQQALAPGKGAGQVTPGVSQVLSGMDPRMQGVQALANQMGFQLPPTHQPFPPPHPMALMGGPSAAAGSTPLEPPSMEAMQGELTHLRELVTPKVVTHKNLGWMLLDLFKNSMDQTTSHSKSRSSSSRKRRKKKKKKKEDGSSTSSSSSSNLSESLEEDNKLRRLARKKPGKLLLLAIKEMAALLATQTGEVSEVTLCPLFTKFYHLQMKSRLTSATQHREAQTLAKALDLLVGERYFRAAMCWFKD